jgi:hypothetical protein
MVLIQAICSSKRLLSKGNRNKETNVTVSRTFLPTQCSSQADSRTDVYLLHVCILVYFVYRMPFMAEYIVLAG